MGSEDEDELRMTVTKSFRNVKGTRSIAKRGDDARSLARRLLAQRGLEAKRKLPQGSPGNAVDWRAKRAGKPKSQQLMQNMEALTGLLVHVEEHTQKLLALFKEREGSSTATSPHSSPPASRGRLSKDFGMPSAPGSPDVDDPVGSAALSEAEDADDIFQEDLCLYHKSSKERGRQMGSKETIESDDEEVVECYVKMERVPSPQRTRKSRNWRPPTPFPRKDLDKATDEEIWQMAAPVEFKAQRRSRASTIAMDVDMFDFCGFGNWRASLKEVREIQKPKRTRTSMALIRPPGD